ncbi:LPS export ABC transporter periplasmic protein LptC [Luteirhabdus pelagi]|uniref:LPS export ABC transporter periplasmic protein LptC n=1 Tax=Luteirhabdus pelagi TaxID=2792783 RepID=UPI001939934B|nr:LPS export ABC transporter periplasmic protein LptC [Luteirhabdus pelagi]
MILYKHFKSVMVLLGAVALFSCEGNYKNVKQLTQKDYQPIAIWSDVNLKYTDSGKVVTNLISPVVRDYSNRGFPYQEFPDGVEVRFWNDKGEKSTVTSDYAIRYDDTDLVDLRNNVRVITADSVELNADQLYWDQKNKWVFTDQPYRIKFKDGSFNEGAVGFDSNQDFTTFLSRRNEGVQIVDTENNDNGK